MLVAVVEVVDVGLVEVHGLLDQPQPEHARVEVDVARRVGGDRRDVVQALECHAVNGSGARRGPGAWRGGPPERGADRRRSLFAGAKGMAAIGTSRANLSALDNLAADRGCDPLRRSSSGRVSLFVQSECSIVVPMASDLQRARRRHLLNGPELRAWRGMLRAHAAMAKALDAQLEAAHGLQLSSYEVLMYLADAEDERMRMCDLASSILLGRSGLTRLVDRLAPRGPDRARRLPRRRPRPVREAHPRRPREAQRRARDASRRRPRAVPRALHAGGARDARQRLGPGARGRRLVLLQDLSAEEGACSPRRGDVSRPRAADAAPRRAGSAGREPEEQVMRKTFTKGRTVAAAALVGAMAIAGVAYATIPTNGVISACYTKSSRMLRVIDSQDGFM